MQETPQASAQKFSQKKDRESAHRILILDPKQYLREFLTTLFAQDPLFSLFSVDEVNEPVALLKTLEQKSFEILLIADDDPKVWIEPLKMVTQLTSGMITLVLAKEWNETSLRQMINQVHLFRALPLTIHNDEILHHLRAASLEAELSRTQTTLLRESSKQNRELEELTLGLEKIVEDRTWNILQSTEATEEKLERARQMIRFTKDLSQNISFEEIMTLIRKEIRRYQKLGDPILLLQMGDSDLEILSFRSGILQEIKLKRDFHFPLDRTSNSKALSLELANLLGRPFGQVMAFPLEIRLIRKYGHHQAAALLCFEGNLGEKEQGHFLSSFNEILRPVAMAVDRSFLEREMITHSFRWEKTFDGLRDPIAVIDEDYKVLRSNNKFSDRLIKKKCHQVFANKEQPCEGCPKNAALGEGKMQTGQIQIGEKIFQVNSYPIQLSQSSGPNSVVNQYMDVTQSREIYARMLQSEKMSALGFLAGNIAHELNNPLSGIRNLTQVMVEEVNIHGQQWPKMETLKTDLIEIEKASARSQKIIKNLLDYTGEGNQQIISISLPEVVEKTMTFLKTVLRQHRLHLDLHARDVNVKVDLHLMQQVVFNLINNACQAMTGVGTLRVETKVSADGKQAFLQVSDTGPGIPAHLKERVFEAFFTTKSEGQGTGLGLSLSREIVRRFGGDLKLESSHKEGAVFVVSLPVDK